MPKNEKPSQLDEQTQIQDIQIRKKNLLEKGYATYEFYPFSDVFFEIYPEDHPLMVESLSEKEWFSEGDPTITKVVNPFAGHGALLGQGRGCMRFMLDAKGLQDHIDHLIEIKKLLEDLNDKDSSLSVSDEPLKLSTEDIEGYKHYAKRIDDRFEAGEIRSGPPDRRTISNIRLYIAEAVKPEEDK